ncbi:MAG: 3-oxoacyl-ACP synthase III, partial [Polyangiaceae bacterium]
LTAPIAARFGRPGDFLEAVTGIAARRFWEPGERPSATAARAGKEAIARSGVDPAAIGVVVSTSVSKDYVEPADACFVHHALGLSERCLNFDLGNACLAFLNGMDVVAQMIEAGRIEHGLVVVGESSRHVVEQTVARYADGDGDQAGLRGEIATLTLGSGAAAILLSHSRHAPEGHAFLGTVTRADTAHNQLCVGHVDRGVTDTQGLMEHGVALAKRTWEAATTELGWSLDSVDLFALHQVSGPHTEELARVVGFDVDRAFPIYPEHGNIGPASIPIVLAKADADGALNAGDRVVLGGIGSGLNCTVGAVVW